jgi:hypothetical protein
VPACADTFYQFKLNTSTISGSTGSLDFQFNAGTGSTQTATATVQNFTGGTFLTVSPTYGSVSGSLPGAVTFTNAAGDNELFGTFIYGSSLSFVLDLSGPAITAPTGLSTGSTTFYLEAFSDPLGVNPALTSDPNGIIATVTINPSGTTKAVAVSPNVNFVPEPGTNLLLGIGVAAIVATYRKRKAQSSLPESQTRQRR